MVHLVKRLIIFGLFCCGSASLASSPYFFFVKNSLTNSALFLSVSIIAFSLVVLIYQGDRTLLSIDEKRYVKSIFPPFLTLFLSNLPIKKGLGFKRSNLIFDGHEDAFRAYLNTCNCYGEYGVGYSTLEAFKYFDKNVYSVDTDRNWVFQTKKYLKSDRHKLGWIDLGDVGSWGYPKNYSKRANIIKYLNYIWEQPQSPDLVLIDGRFRIACFLTTLKKCNIGTIIIFDDYTSREKYHVVEELIIPEKFFGRQAVFRVEKSFENSKIDKLIDQFMFVMD